MVSDKPRRKTDWQRVGAIAGVVAAVVAIASFVASSSSSGGKGGGGSNTVTGGSPESGGTTMASPIYLDELPVTDGSPTSKRDVNASGTPLAHGVSLGTVGTVPGVPNIVTFQLPNSYSTIRALLGVDPTSAASYTGSFAVRILAGDQTIANTTIDQGTLCSVDVQTGGSRTIKLETYLASGEPMVVVFGDLRAINGTDFPNEPSANACP